MEGINFLPEVRMEAFRMMMPALTERSYRKTRKPN
jgi:hypothetical protein